MAYCEMDIRLNIHIDCSPETVKRLCITDGWALTLDRALDQRKAAFRLQWIPTPPSQDGKMGGWDKTIFKSEVY